MPTLNSTSQIVKQRKVNNRLHQVRKVTAPSARRYPLYPKPLGTKQANLEWQKTIGNLKKIEKLGGKISKEQLRAIFAFAIDNEIAFNKINFDLLSKISKWKRTPEQLRQGFGAMSFG
ncbi:MAG: hypothetical protein PHQ98_02005 [Candidatus ainarchaeum sp.]|nr:hypothetical protein [Candidatus ainarchaeum sp.]